MKKLRVLILCGGKSAERRVSLVSAKLVFDSLDRRKFSPRLVYIDPRGRWFEAGRGLLAGKVAKGEASVAGLKEASLPDLLSSGRRPDVVFPVLHGPLGEDGSFQGLFEVFGLPYVGCGVLGSAVGMDKEFTKLLAVQAGLPVLPYIAVREAKEARGAARKLGLPLFVKPARLGSSVGVSKVKTAAGLAAALKTAFLYDDKVLIEKGVSAREIECAVLDGRASVCGEIAPNTEFYSYQSKYLDASGARHDIPAALPAKTAAKIQALALRAFRALDGYGMARADFFLDKRTGAVYFNEINTLPGFTPTSMYPLLWKASGTDTPRLLERLIRLALTRHAVRARLKTSP